MSALGPGNRRSLRGNRSILIGFIGFMGFIGLIGLMGLMGFIGFIGVYRGFGALGFGVLLFLVFNGIYVGV